MKPRPTSITVIAWILIVTGGISLISTLAMINNPTVLELMSKSPIPIPLQYVLNFVGLTITIVSGIALLKGANWGRLLYVGWSIVGLAIGVATSPLKAALIPSAVLFFIFAFFLFRPRANDFFTSSTPSIDA